MILDTTLPTKFRDNNYHIFKVIKNEASFKCFIDEELILDTNDITYKDNISKFALSYSSSKDSGFTQRSTNIKFIKIKDLSGNELFYDDYKNIITKEVSNSAVHLPLETNSNNIGFTNLNVSAVGSPTYHVIDDKKCVKFGSGKYLSLPTNNIFNLGINSDFYIELDFNVISNKNYNFLFCNDNVYTNPNLLMVFLSVDGKLRVRLINNNDIYTSEILSTNINHNFKMYRKNSKMYIELNSTVINIEQNININLSLNAFFLGTSGWNTTNDNLDGYMSNFKMFVGTSKIPDSYNQFKVLDLDFKPTRKSYLFKDNNNKCVIHPTNITQRDFKDSKYCCTFNGTDQYLQLGRNDLLNFGNDDFVINIKFKKEGVIIGNESLISSGEVSSVVGRVGILLDPSTNQVYIHTNTNSGYFYLASSNTITSGINELLIVKNDGVISLILNNVTTSGSFKYALNLNINDNTNIGLYALTNNYFNGQIYSVKILRNTTDLSLLENTEDIFEINEKFELTNGTDTQVIEYTELDKREVKIVNDTDKLSLYVNDDFIEVIKDDNLPSNIELFKDYTGDIKEINVYNTPFYDKDIFLGTELKDTEFGEISIEDEEDLYELFNGDYSVKGFIEGYLDREFNIIYENNIVFSGVEDYEYKNIDENYIEEYLIHDLVTGEKYKVLNQEMIKGFISGTVNLKNCGVTAKNMEVFCYRSDNYRHIGTYPVSNDGKYLIPNLDVNSRYDIIFRDKTRKIKDQISNYRKPMKY